MKRKMKVDRNVNKDVELCRTTNHYASRKTAEALMESSIPFTSCWKRIPFFKREEYHGASEVCIISINRNEYSRARRSLTALDVRHRQRLLLNVI